MGIGVEFSLKNVYRCHLDITSGGTYTSCVSAHFQVLFYIYSSFDVGEHGVLVL
jgi:hypothetical protein